MNLINPFRSIRSSRPGFVLARLSFVTMGAPAVHAAGNLADGWSVRADSGAGADDKGGGYS